MVEYIQADGGNPPFISESFQNIVAFHSLHHLPQLSKAFVSYHSLLKRGGHLVAYDHIRASKLGRYIQERYIKFMVKMLWLKNKPSFSFKSGCSFHEDVSLGQLNLADGVFVKKYFKEEAYFLKLLPIFCYFNFGRHGILLKTLRKFTVLASYTIGIVIPSTREFALGVWEKRK
jgi:SAM-dependent methyltransferase